jgi:methyl-accepting chemotaxis protein
MFSSGQGAHGPPSISLPGACRKITEVIGKVNDTVSEIMRDLETQAGTTREIAANISRASTGVNDVNDNVNQSSTTAGEISREISPAVSKQTSDIMQISTQVKSSSNTLDALAKGLIRTVARFKY